MCDHAKQVLSNTLFSPQSFYPLPKTNEYFMKPTFISVILKWQNDLRSESFYELKYYNNFVVEVENLFIVLKAFRVWINDHSLIT